MELRARQVLRSIIFLSAVTVPGQAASLFVQTNLLSDLPGITAQMDSGLVNPWGLVASATSPWWVSDNGTGITTIYNGTGNTARSPVNIPGPGGTGSGAPTGVIFNSTASDFQLSDGAKATFIFSTEDGTIAAWNNGAGNTALEPVDNSSSGAVYKGLASGSNSKGNFLYAANFNAGTIDVFDSNFKPATVSGGFSDPGIPTGFAPFNIANIGGMLYVSYAKQDDAKHDDVAAPGNGYIDVFGTDGVLVKRLVSNGPLNSPWGLVSAPSGFGDLGGDLLVGNFGDGTIDAFSPISGALIGELLGMDGHPITIEGLWGLSFGNGSGSGPAGSLFFTAGISDGKGGDKEEHGLFGTLTPFAATPIPEPAGGLMMAGGALLLLGLRRITRR